MEKHDEIYDDQTGIDVKKVNTIGTFPRRRANFSLTLSQDNKLFVVGGSSMQSEYEDFYFLDLKSYMWTRIPYPMQHTLVGHKSVYLTSEKSETGAILIYGGWKTENYNDSLFLIELDTHKAKESKRIQKKMFKTIHDVINNGNQKSKSEEHKPSARRDHTLDYVGKWERVVLVGGWNALQWNPTMVDLEWLKMECDFLEDCYEPLNRRGHSSVYHRGTDCVYVYGGVFGYSYFLEDSFKIKMSKCKTKVRFEKFGMVSNPKSFHPEARAWHSASLIRDKIFYYGGKLNKSCFSNDLVTYDIYSDSWSVCYIKGDNMERCSHSAIVFNTSILILGGYNYKEVNGTEDLIKFRGKSTHSSKIKYLEMDTVLVIETENFTRRNTVTPMRKQVSNESNSSNSCHWNFDTFPEIQEFQKKRKVIKQKSRFIEKNTFASSKEEEAQNKEDPFKFLGETE